MIFYFSGTGNSHWIAKKVAQCIHEQLIPINEKTVQTTYTLGPDECIGWIFPIHAWAPPRHILQYIKRLNIIQMKGHYGFFVCTCGDDIGYADKLFMQTLTQYGFPVHSGFSVQMPNTYVCLPGFDIDDFNTCQEKIIRANHFLTHITETIKKRKIQDFKLYHGKFPWIKSYILRPLFNHFLVTDRYFFSSEACIGCGQCVINCPNDNIIMKQQKPIWMGNCTTCLSCYHHCPVHAIRFGSQTESKGQYTYSSIYYQINTNSTANDK